MAANGTAKTAMAVPPNRSGSCSWRLFVPSSHGVHDQEDNSRITRWLNAFGFPVKLTATALADRNYHNFVSDGFQQLCEACEIMPCVLDAAIFSSFDEGKWTEENVVW